MCCIHFRVILLWVRSQITIWAATFIWSVIVSEIPGLLLKGIGKGMVK